MRTRRLGFIGLFVLAILAGTAGAASAHAALVSTSPNQSTHFAAGSPPSSVSVRFDDEVTTTAKSIGVYDGAGHAMKVTLVRTEGEKVVSAQLPRLADGSYAVVWHIVSDDGHPETGAFTFSVGAATASTTSLSSLEASRKAGPGIGIGFGVDRFLEFFACLTLVGAVAFGRWRWPAVLARRGVRRSLIGLAAVGVLSTLASISLEAVYSSGGGASTLFNGSALRQVVDARFGTAALWRAGLLLVLACYAIAPVVTAKRGRRIAAEIPLALAALAVGATFAYGGHGYTGRWPVFGLVLDISHLTAAAVWLGGLVLLAVALRRHADPEEARAALGRFSRLALPAIAVVVLSGTLQGWRQIGTWSALWHTSYARLLIIKVLVVLAIVVLASASRDALRGRLARRPSEVDLTDDFDLGATGSPFDGMPDPFAGQGNSRVAVGVRPTAALELIELEEAEAEHAVREVRVGVLLEVGLAAVVLAVTSLLVVSPPGREAVAAAKVPQAQTIHLTATGTTVGYSVAMQPMLAGQNTVVVNPRLTAGSGLLPTSLTGTVRAAGSATGARLTFTALPNGQWVAVAPLTTAGTWTVQLDEATPSAGESTSFRVTVR
jgi:copper transport protein